MNQKGFSALIVLISVMVLVGIAGISYYIGRSSSGNTKTPVTPSPVASQPEDSLIPSPASSPSNISLLGNPIKRLYFPGEKIFTKMDYPIEMTGINDGDLHNLQCSPDYYRDYEKQHYTYQEDPRVAAVEMKDQNLYLLAEKAFEIDLDADVYRACKVDDGRYILEYEKQGGGGGSNNKSIFGVLGTDKTFQKITEIPTDGSPYFGCYKTLQLTKSNILWYQCGGGDGGYGSVSVYKIDLSNKNHTLVTKCEAISDPMDLDKTDMKCQ